MIKKLAAISGNLLSVHMICLFMLLQACGKSTKEVSRVKSSSMEPTIMASAQITWIKVESNHVHKRGDILVMNSPTGDGHWIRRVIGFTGDVVEIRIDGALINGEFSSWGELTNGAAGSVEKTEPPIKVPDRHLYFIGDNLNNSRDSREFGPLPSEIVVGRVLGFNNPRK